ncbi:MAG: FAD-dependent oxidoreductase, partial [Elusimicrobiaceae bacterium]|nr:FAD-dependent oxidoreductase [Elusimicrobiaceae bacterium]
MAAHVKNVRLNAPVTKIDLKTKTAWVKNEKITFENIVSTVPLPQLVNLLTGHDDLKRTASQLDAQPVTVYHLAIARPVEPFSWIYCPDAAQPFYRVGLTSSFAPGSVPDKNTSLFYIE